MAEAGGLGGSPAHSPSAMYVSSDDPADLRAPEPVPSPYPSDDAVALGFRLTQLHIGGYQPRLLAEAVHAAGAAGRGLPAAWGDRRCGRARAARDPVTRQQLCSGLPLAHLNGQGPR